MAGRSVKATQQQTAAHSRSKQWRLLDLDNAQVERLQNMQWLGSGSSWTEPTMDIFWDRIASFTPHCISPNLITFCGLLSILIGCLPILLYKADGSADCPAAAYVACAVAIFIYQTCDAVDGKLARATGNCSELGTLLDWAVDTVAQFVVPITACLCLDVGQLGAAWLVYLPVIYITGFYAASSQACMFGIYPFGWFDDTETQLIMVAMHLCTALFGPTIWDVQLPLLLCQHSVSLRIIMLVVLWFPEVNALLTQLTTVCKYLSHRVIKSETDEATSEQHACDVRQQACVTKHLLDPHGILYPILHPTVATASAWLLVHAAPDVLDRHPVLLSVLACLPIAKANCMHIVSTMTAEKTVFRVLDRMWFGPVALLAFASLRSSATEVVLCVAALFGAADLLIWLTNALLDVSMYLEVPLVRARPPKHAVSKAH